MPKSWRCIHHSSDKDRVCANCGKKISWASINHSRTGFWFHTRSQMETCAETVATPGNCYHDAATFTKAIKSGRLR